MYKMHVVNKFVRLFGKHVTVSKTAVLELDSAAGCGLTRGTADAEALSAILGSLFGAAALTVIDRSTRLYFYHVSCDAPSRVPLFSFFLRKSFCFHFWGFSAVSTHHCDGRRFRMYVNKR